MKEFLKIFILITGVVQFNYSFGQETSSDTIFIKRTVQVEKVEIDTILIEGGISPAQPQILIGTTFLPYSNKMIGLLNKGLSPISFEIIEECDRSSEPNSLKAYPKFVNVKRESDTLTIDVIVVANCCHNFLEEAEVSGNDILNLVYT